MNLEKYIILDKFILSLFGFNDFNTIRNNLKNKPEGFNNYGYSDFIECFITKENSFSRKKLLKYDKGIKEYSKKISKNRKNEIVFRYFQYVAILFAEIYLDLYFNNRAKLKKDLNTYLRKYEEEKGVKISPFNLEELQKIAYWMATGSGKTLIMHVNYLQFLKYNSEQMDNILLITANQELSKQHYEEMRKSGIPCQVYDEGFDPTLFENQVLIIDIYKLTQKKKGGGVRIETSSFEGKI